jgi:hypothetical protein
MLTRVLYVDVEMTPSRFGAECVAVCFELNRHSNELPMTDAAFGNNMSSKVPHVMLRALRNATSRQLA